MNEENNYMVFTTEELITHFKSIFLIAKIVTITFQYIWNIVSELENNS